MAESDNNNNINLEVNHEKFQKTQAQLEDIATEIRKEQPLTSELLPIQELQKKYEAGSNFDKGVQSLAKDYQGVRIIRGDGNCYYRAFLYSLCEKLWQADKEEQARLKTVGT